MAVQLVRQVPLAGRADERQRKRRALGVNSMCACLCMCVSACACARITHTQSHARSAPSSRAFASLFAKFFKRADAASSHGVCVCSLSGRKGSFESPQPQTGFVQGPNQSIFEFARVAVAGVVPVFLNLHVADAVVEDRCIHGTVVQVFASDLFKR